MNLRISARARDDLDSIFAWIYVRQGLEAAERFLGAAREAVNFLGQHPQAGPHPRWAGRHPTLRSAFIFAGALIPVTL
jgi:plasmid stabilization system protein ParE